MAPDDVELVEADDAPDGVATRQHFRIRIGRQLGHCYVEDAPDFSPAEWTVLVAKVLNDLIRRHGYREVFSALCADRVGMSLDITPGLG